MDQQTVNVAVKRRALSNRANVRLLRLKEVLAICGKSRTSVYDAVKKGDFPNLCSSAVGRLPGSRAKWHSGQSIAFVPADRTQDIETLRDRARHTIPSQPSLSSLHASRPKVLHDELMVCAGVMQTGQ